MWAILMFSFIVWAKSQDSVHKPQFFEEKRKESRSGSNRGPSAYQPSALPLGHTGSHFEGVGGSAHSLPRSAVLFLTNAGQFRSKARRDSVAVSAAGSAF